MTGTLSGEQNDAAAQKSGVSLLHAAMNADWLHEADFALTTHVWIGGWSFLVLRSWMYKAVAILLVAAFVGMLVLVARKKRGPLLICGAVALLFWIAPAYHALEGYRVTGKTESFGYYAYCVVAAEAACLIAGIGALLPGRAARYVVPGLTTSFAALEIYGMVFLQMPYYGGFIAHSPGGSVPAIHIGQLAGGGLARLFRNLALGKPWFLPAPVLATLFACYLLAVGGIIAAAFLLAQGDPEVR